MHLTTLLRKPSISQKSHSTSSSKASKLSAKVITKVKHLVRKFEGLGRKQSPFNPDLETFKPCYVRPSKSNDLLAAIAHLSTCGKASNFGSDGSIDKPPTIVVHLHELYYDSIAATDNPNIVGDLLEAIEEPIGFLGDCRHQPVITPRRTDIRDADRATITNPRRNFADCDSIVAISDTDEIDWASIRCLGIDPDFPLSSIEFDIPVDSLLQPTTDTNIKVADALHQSVFEIKPCASYPSFNEVLLDPIFDTEPRTSTPCTPPTPQTPVRTVGTSPPPKTSETDLIARKIEKLRGRYRAVAIKAIGNDPNAFASTKLREALGLNPPGKPVQRDNDEDDVFYSPPTMPREGRALLPSAEPVLGNPPTFLWHPQPQRTWRPVILCKYS